MKPVMGQVASNRARVYGALKPVLGQETSKEGLGVRKPARDQRAQQ